MNERPIDPTERGARPADGVDEGLFAAAARATEPSAVEVGALLRRLPPEGRRGAAPAWAWLAPLAAAALLVVWLWPGAPYGPAPAPGDVLQLASADRAVGPSIALRGDAVLEVVAAGPEGTRLRLRSGRVLAQVDPRGPHRALAIEAPGGVTVRVVGTVFAVAWDAAAGRGAVSVERGRVAISDPRGTRAIGAGERFAWSDARAAGGPGDGGDAATTGMDAVVPGVAGARAEANEPSEGEAAAGAAWADSGTDALAAPSTGRPAAVSTGGGPAPHGGAGPDAAPGSSARPGEGAGGRGEAVATLDPRAPAAASDRPERAGADLSAARVLVAVQIALDEGRDADAVRLADDLIRAVPDGPLAREAGALRVEGLAAADPAGAVAAASAWLTRNPGHPRALDVLRLRATLARDHLRDCALAHPADAALAAATSGAEQARAWALAGLCAADVGDGAAAARAIDAALAHPDLPPALAPRLRAARRDLPEARP